MSVVIIGGHDRMVCRYENICKECGCKAKVYTQAGKNLECQIGNPDLIILFTNPVSHKMAGIAKRSAERKNVTLIQSHCASCDALKTILNGRATALSAANRAV